MMAFLSGKWTFLLTDCHFVNKYAAKRQHAMCGFAEGKVLVAVCHGLEHFPRNNVEKSLKEDRSVHPQRMMLQVVKVEVEPSQHFFHVVGIPII